MIGEANKLPPSIINPIINVRVITVYHVQAETSSEHHYILATA